MTQSARRAGSNDAATGPDAVAGSTPIMLRPARADDGAAVWELLAPAAAEVIGMSSLPGSATAAKQICIDTAETIAALATGSFELADGGHRRLLFVACEPDSEILGLTGVTFKRAVPNLAVQVTTSEDGEGLIMRSSSVPWTRTELDSSFLGGKARGRSLGTLLSRGRFMLLHLVNSQIPGTIASHLRGRFDSDGSAPFWRCFGAHLAPHWQSSTEAELALLADPNRLDELAGHVRPLTASVLESLGPVNAASMPAFHLLRAEGLKPNGMYDPIDGGPTVVARLSDTVTGRRRTHGRARLGSAGPTDALVSVATVDRFRVVRAGVTIDEASTITIDAGLAAAVDIRPDAILAAAPLAPTTGAEGATG
ncbi:MAG: arginine N-succinyltransferase [Acidimicrobiales bacterium]